MSKRKLNSLAPLTFDIIYSLEKKNNYKKSDNPSQDAQNPFRYFRKKTLKFVQYTCSICLPRTIAAWSLRRWWAGFGGRRLRRGRRRGGSCRRQKTIISVAVAPWICAFVVLAAGGSFLSTRDASAAAHEGVYLLSMIDIVVQHFILWNDQTNITSQEPQPRLLLFSSHFFVNVIVLVVVFFQDGNLWFFCHEVLFLDAGNSRSVWPLVFIFQLVVHLGTQLELRKIQAGLVPEDAVPYPCRLQGVVQADTLVVLRAALEYGCEIFERPKDSKKHLPEFNPVGQHCFPHGKDVIHVCPEVRWEVYEVLEEKDDCDSYVTAVEKEEPEGLGATDALVVEDVVQDQEEVSLFVVGREFSGRLDQEVNLSRTEAAVDAGLWHTLLEHIGALHGGAHCHREVEAILQGIEHVLEEAAFPASTLSHYQTDTILLDRGGIKLFDSHLHPFCLYHVSKSFRRELQLLTSCSVGSSIQAPLTRFSFALSLSMRYTSAAYSRASR